MPFVAAGVANTWDPASMSFVGAPDGGTLDATKLIFTVAVAADSCVFTLKGNQTGKRYLECSWAGTGIQNTINGNNQVIVMLARTGSAWPTTGLLYCFGDGLYSINGTAGSCNANIINATPTFLAMAIDFDVSKMWCGNDTSGIMRWNNDVLANQNPVGAVGGQDFSPLLNGTPVVFGIGPRATTGDTVTLNVGPTWHYSIPSGFSAW